MNKNINLALITIGNGNWKNVIKNLWESLDINEEGFQLDRCYDEYFAKLEMQNYELPSELTNKPMKIDNGYTLRLFISMPVISNYNDNDKMVLLPWYENETDYKIASKICCGKTIANEYYNNIIILLGDKLDKNEMEIRNHLAESCVDNNKTFWEIGNDCGCMNIDMINKWIESEENYCCWHSEDVKRTVKVG